MLVRGQTVTSASVVLSSGCSSTMVFRAPPDRLLGALLVRPAIGVLAVPDEAEFRPASPACSSFLLVGHGASPLPSSAHAERDCPRDTNDGQREPSIINSLWPRHVVLRSTVWVVVIVLVVISVFLAGPEKPRQHRRDYDDAGERFEQVGHGYQASTTAMSNP